MADRDLQTQGQAFHHVLAMLQRDVRTLKSRAGRPGAVRSDDRDPISPQLAGLTNGVAVTLNELHLDPGSWVLFARGQAEIHGAVFTGRETVNTFINVIGSSTSAATTLAIGTNSPTCPSGAGGVFATMWSVFGFHHSDDVFTVVQQGSSGDWTGSVHAVSWTRAHLLALPM